MENKMTPIIPKELQEEATKYADENYEHLSPEHDELDKQVHKEFADAYIFSALNSSFVEKQKDEFAKGFAEWAVRNYAEKTILSISSKILDNYKQSLKEKS